MVVSCRKSPVLVADTEPVLILSEITMVVSRRKSPVLVADTEPVYSQR